MDIEQTNCIYEKKIIIEENQNSSCRNAESFHAEHACREASIFLCGKPEATFPLFTPVHESEWEPAFQPVFLTSAEPLVPGLVFLTRSQDRGDTIWIMSAYVPAERKIEYIRVTPASDVAIIRIRVMPSGSNDSEAHISYTFTGLTPAGNDYIRLMTDEKFALWLADWQEAINNLLRAV